MNVKRACDPDMKKKIVIRTQLKWLYECSSPLVVTFDNLVLFEDARGLEGTLTGLW